MNMRIILVLFWLLSGCTQLLLTETDTPSERTAKIATRVVLGLATIGFSEVHLEAAQQREAWAAQKRLAAARCPADTHLIVNEALQHIYGCMTDAEYAAFVRAQHASLLPVQLQLLSTLLQQSSMKGPAPIPEPITWPQPVICQTIGSTTYCR